MSEKQKLEIVEGKLVTPWGELSLVGGSNLAWATEEGDDTPPPAVINNYEGYLKYEGYSFMAYAAEVKDHFQFHLTPIHIKLDTLRIHLHEKLHILAGAYLWERRPNA